MSPNTALAVTAQEKTFAWAGIKAAPLFEEHSLSLEQQQASILIQAYDAFTELMSCPPDRQRTREAQRWMRLWTRVCAIEIWTQQKKYAEDHPRMREEAVIELRVGSMIERRIAETG